MVMSIFWFARTMRRTISYLYKDNAEETQINEIKRDMEVSAALSYLRSILENGIKAMWSVQVNQWEIKTGN